MSPRVFFGIMAGVVVSFSAAGERRVPLPKPAPQLRKEPSVDGAALRNRGCESCHSEIAREWRASRHRVAHDSPEFSRALAREPSERRAFCVRCHAPEAAPSAPSQKTAALGVGCVTCHVPLGPVLAAPHTGATGSERAPHAVPHTGAGGERAPHAVPHTGASGGERAPHAVLRTDAMTNGDACASCHEFAFPGGEAHGMMQRTVSEHRAAAGADLGCNGCHMPWVGEGARRHRSHAFRGGHDAAFVRSSLAVSATRPEPTRVRIVLTPQNVTHAVPTGDLFRRLTVTASVPSGTRRVRHLARHFRAGTSSREELADDRPYRAPKEVDFWLPEAAAGEVVSWQVSYERVAYLPGGDEDRAVLDGTVVIAKGTLAPGK